VRECCAVVVVVLCRNQIPRINSFQFIYIFLKKY